MIEQDRALCLLPFTREKRWGGVFHKRLLLRMGSNKDGRSSIRECAANKEYAVTNVGGKSSKRVESGPNSIRESSIFIENVGVSTDSRTKLNQKDQKNSTVHASR